MSVEFKDNLLVQTLLVSRNEEILRNRVSKLTKEERQELVQAIQEIAAVAHNPKPLIERGIAVLLLVDDEELKPVKLSKGDFIASAFKKNSLTDNAIMTALSSTTRFLRAQSLEMQELTPERVRSLLSNRIGLLKLQENICGLNDSQKKEFRDLPGFLEDAIEWINKKKDIRLNGPRDIFHRYNPILERLVKETDPLRIDSFKKINVKIGMILNILSEIQSVLEFKEMKSDEVIDYLKRLAKNEGFSDSEIDPFLPKSIVSPEQVLHDFAQNYVKGQIMNMIEDLEIWLTMSDEQLPSIRAEKVNLESHLDLYNDRLAKREERGHFEVGQEESVGSIIYDFYDFTDEVPSVKLPMQKEILESMIDDFTEICVAPEKKLGLLESLKLYYAEKGLIPLAPPRPINPAPIWEPQNRTGTQITSEAS